MLLIASLAIFKFSQTLIQHFKVPFCNFHRFQSISTNFFRLQNFSLIFFLLISYFCFLLSIAFKMHSGLIHFNLFRLETSFHEFSISLAFFFSCRFHVNKFPFHSSFARSKYSLSFVQFPSSKCNFKNLQSLNIKLYKICFSK